MGRGPKRPRKAPRAAPSKKPSRDKRPLLEDDSEDEIDAFHKQRDVIPLDVDADGVSDDDSEQPVFDLEGADEDDSDEGGNDEDDSDECGNDEDDDDEEVICDKELAKWERKAAYMKQIVAAGDDDISDDAEPEEESRGVWGRNKSSYYGEELDSSDDEAWKNMEDEVLKLQKERASFLRPEDFGLPDDSGPAPDKGDGRKAMTKSNLDGVLGGIPLENYEEIKIPNDINALTREEQMDLINSSAPELVGLLSDLNEALDQLEKIKPLLCKMKENKDVTRGGKHYLEVKHNMLLTYCQAISFYFLLKSEGHPVRDHPVVDRLQEIKSLSEKLKRIDANLPSQIEELFCHNSVNVSQDKLVSEIISSEMKLDTAEVSARSHEVSKAADLVDDHPKEYHSKAASQKQQDVKMGLQSMQMLKVRANLEAKLKQKGIYNLANSKLERHQNHARVPVNRHLETIDDFDDEVQHTGVLHPSKISQIVATKAKKPKFVSGDDDLPKRDDIGERRRKHELRFLARAGDDDLPKKDDIGERRRNKELRVLAGAGAESMDMDVEEDGEDEFYQEVKKKREEKLKAKSGFYTRDTAPPLLEPEADGKRNISYQIEKNKGLTRSRKKETKTPRKKYRVKYEDARIRRKGQVRDIKKPSGPYGGELTGINMNISRSRRFKS